MTSNAQTHSALASSWPQLVALDVDGTVLHHDGALSDRVRQSVQALAAQSHVVLATGRSLVSTLPVLDRLSLLEGYAVCSNGAVTIRLDASSELGYEVVEAVTFDPSDALRLLRRELPTALYAVEEVGTGFRLTAPFPDGELTGDMRVVDFDELLHTPATRVVVRSPEHTPEEFLELTADLGLHGVNYSVGWTAWLDLAPEGVSKASALASVCERLGVDPGATLAVGDGRNDLEMLGWAARGVAMGNAPAQVRDAADEVCGDVAGDGLAVLLEDLLRSAA